MFSSAYKAVNSFLIILLVTNQSGTNFNVARQSSTALSHICWVLHWSGTCIVQNRSSQIIMLHISWVSGWLGLESKRKTSTDYFITNFFSHEAFRNKFYKYILTDLSHIFLRLIAFRKKF